MNRNVWVGWGQSPISSQDIEREFGAFGALTDIRYSKEKNCAFVDFRNPEDAAGAVACLHGCRLPDGGQFRVEFARHAHSGSSSKVLQHLSLPCSLTAEYASRACLT